MKKLAALLLTACISIAPLASCGGDGGDKFKLPAGGEAPTKEYPLEYSLTREDWTKYLDLIKVCKKVTLASKPDETAIEKAWDDFLNHYDHIGHQYYMSYILYFWDMGDEYLIQEYEFAAAMSSEAYNRYIDLCVDIYESKAPYRDEFFSDWSQDEINMILSYTGDYAELTMKSEDILMEYRELEDSEFMDGACELYAELVVTNNQIAEINGYDDYYTYAYENIYHRDYDHTAIENLRAYAKAYLVPMMTTYSSRFFGDFYSLKGADSDNFENFVWGSYTGSQYFDDYVAYLTHEVEGEQVPDNHGAAMKHAFDEGNVLFGTNPKSREGAFNIDIPYENRSLCYFGPGYTSPLTIVHELGHYYGALYLGDNDLPFDLAETQSQGNEWLMIEWLESQMNENVYRALFEYRLWDLVCTSVGQIVIDNFEERVYKAEGVENWTPDDFSDLFEEVCDEYGGYSIFDGYYGMSDRDSFGAGMHYYWRAVVLENPVYYVSYAVSNISAFDIFLKERAVAGEGRAAYKNIVENYDFTKGYKENFTGFGIDTCFDEDLYKKLWTLTYADSEPFPTVTIPNS